MGPDRSKTLSVRSRLTCWPSTAPASAVVTTGSLDVESPVRSSLMAAEVIAPSGSQWIDCSSKMPMYTGPDKRDSAGNRW